MPAIYSSLPNTLLNILVDRNAPAANATVDVLQVVCAWPVSGQYGPGSRVLYYVLIATCIFAQKQEWLRRACLAAALLFPAVAAIHGIVLAALHVDNAVDMDIYGAFQLCAIGILAVPVTVKLSDTYWKTPGRNTIFLWTGLVLAGLLSLAVEFYRVQTSDCKPDDPNLPYSLDPDDFPYNTLCGLACDVDYPTSPLRLGSANNIYVVPAPNRLSLGTATLIAAACCIPAILSMVSMWNKIRETNWKRGKKAEEQSIEEVESKDAADDTGMKRVNGLIRVFLNLVEVPVFGAAILAILIVGERNFFSGQVSYQTEPMASIGQWAPILGTSLAVLGSLSLIIATKLSGFGQEKPARCSECHCNRSTQGVDEGPYASSAITVSPDGIACTSSTGGEGSSSEVAPASSPHDPRKGSWSTVDKGNRRKVAEALLKVSNYLGNARNQFDISDFKSGKAHDFPEIPGEGPRNPALSQIKERYNVYRDASIGGTPSLRRASVAPSIVSSLDIEGDSTTPPETSPQLPQRALSSISATSSIIPVAAIDSMSQSQQVTFEVQGTPSSPTTILPAVVSRQRSDTLEVPLQQPQSRLFSSESLGRSV